MVILSFYNKSGLLVNAAPLNKLFSIDDIRSMTPRGGKVKGVIALVD